MQKSLHDKLNDALHAVGDRAETITLLTDGKFALSESDLTAIERNARDIINLCNTYRALNK